MGEPQVQNRREYYFYTLPKEKLKKASKTADEEMRRSDLLVTWLLASTSTNTCICSIIAAEGTG